MLSKILLFNHHIKMYVINDYLNIYIFYVEFSLKTKEFRYIISKILIRIRNLPVKHSLKNPFH